MNKYIMSSTEMDLKQAGSLDLLKAMLCIWRRSWIRPVKCTPGWVCSYSLRVANRQTEQESPDEENGKMNMGTEQESIKNPLPPHSTNTTWVVVVSSLYLVKCSQHVWFRACTLQETCNPGALVLSSGSMLCCSLSVTFISLLMLVYKDYLHL